MDRETNDPAADAPAAPDATAAAAPDPSAAPDPADSGPAFARTLDAGVLSFGETKPQASVCAWCNRPLPGPGLETCPSCGAQLTPLDETLLVPGVNTLSEEAETALQAAQAKRLRGAAERGESMLAAAVAEAASPPVPMPDEAEIEAALRPPDEAVLRVMAELEVEARRAAREGVGPEVEPAPSGDREPLATDAGAPAAEDDDPA